MAKLAERLAASLKWWQSSNSNSTLIFALFREHVNAGLEKTSQKSDHSRLGVVQYR